MAPISAVPYYPSLAATDTEVALAWLEPDADGLATLKLARLSPALDLIDTKSIRNYTFEGRALVKPSGAVDPWMSMTMAPLSTSSSAGWVVAGWALSDLFVQTLDSAGQMVGYNVVATGLTSGDLPSSIRIVARPDGGPAVVWATMHKLHVIVMATNGTVFNHVDVDISDEQLTGAVLAGGSVYVSTYAVSEDVPRARFRRLAADGAIVATFDALVGVVQNSLALVDGADDLRVDVGTKKDDAHPIVATQRLDAAGASLGAAVELGASPAYEEGKAVAFGDETFSLLRGPGLGVARAGADDALVTPTSPITVPGSSEPSWFAIARSGSDAIAAWVGRPEDGFRIARLTR